MIKCVVFDFDGVLVDTNLIKRKAYFDIFLNFGDVEETIDSIISNDPYSNRYIIIGRIIKRLEEIGKIHVGDRFETLVNEFALKYNNICESFASTCFEIPGASLVLKELSEKYRIYVNSLTPEEPLERIIFRRGWKNYFNGIYGGSKTKKENLKKILEREKISATESVFVGDKENDLEAAMKVGCHFIGVKNKFNDFNSKGVILIESLNDLCHVIQRKFG